MATTTGLGILAPENAEKRAEILELLERAYWMEIETVMTSSRWPTASTGSRRTW